MYVFDTDRVQPDDPVAAWNAVTRDTFGPIGIRPAGLAPFRGRLTRRRSGAVRLASVHSDPALVEGAGGTARRRPGHFLLLNESGQSVVSQGQREITLAARRLAVIRADEPYRISFCDPNHMVVVHVPEAPPSVDWDRLTGDPLVDTDQPLLAELLRQWSRAGAAATEHDAATYGRLVHDVLSVCCGPGTRAGLADHSAAAGWAERIDRFVAANLTDPRLSARFAGQALGASTRYIQLVMTDQRITFSRYVLARRLEHAAERLVDDREASVARIAHECGFTDISHFSHAFRARFGCTATEWRRSH